MNQRNFFPIFLSFTLLLVVVGCQSSETSCENSKELDAAKQAYSENQNVETATKYIAQLQDAAGKTCVSDAKAATYLKDAEEVAKSVKSTPLEMSVIYTHVKRFGPSKDPEKMITLAQLLKNARKPEASDMLLYGYAQSQTDPDKKQEALDMMVQQIENPNAFIDTLRKQAYQTSEGFGVDINKARAYIDASEAYVMSFPDDVQSPQYLFNAGEVAKSIRSFNKSFALFDQLRAQYPDHEKAPTALFLKGFIIENEVKNDTQAREIYEQFLKEYPNHDLADDVQFLIQNLGKSEEEILKSIQIQKQEQ